MYLVCILLILLGRENQSLFWMFNLFVMLHFRGTKQWLKVSNTKLGVTVNGMFTLSVAIAFSCEPNIGLSTELVVILNVSDFLGNQTVAQA